MGTAELKPDEVQDAQRELEPPPEKPHGMVVCVTKRGKLCRPHLVEARPLVLGIHYKHSESWADPMPSEQDIHVVHPLPAGGRGGSASP